MPLLGFHFFNVSSDICNNMNFYSFVIGPLQFLLHKHTHTQTHQYKGLTIFSSLELFEKEHGKLFTNSSCKTYLTQTKNVAQSEIFLLSSVWIKKIPASFNRVIRTSSKRSSVIPNFIESLLLPNVMFFKFFSVVFAHILTTTYIAANMLFYSPVMCNKIQDQI